MNWRVRQGYGALTAAYGAPFINVNFADPAAPSQINAWVNQQTRGGIPSLVQAADMDPARNFGARLY